MYNGSSYTPQLSRHSTNWPCLSYFPQYKLSPGRLFPCVLPAFIPPDVFSLSRRPSFFNGVIVILSHSKVWPGHSTFLTVDLINLSWLSYNHHLLTPHNFTLHYVWLPHIYSHFLFYYIVRSQRVEESIKCKKDTDNIHNSVLVTVNVNQKFLL